MLEVMNDCSDDRGKYFEISQPALLVLVRSKNQMNPLVSSTNKVSS